MLSRGQTQRENMPKFVRDVMLAAPTRRSLLWDLVAAV
jgi:hypothetical protein